MVDRMVTCPQCEQPSRYHDSNPYRPFCSERCRQIDLGAWANESHRLPEHQAPDNDFESS
jgi:endogenous inhibitor of DNA gyrase (YacG/DUF329 family)